MDQLPLAHRILVADDDSMIRFLVRTVAEGEGCQVVEANDGGEAYRLLSTDSDFGGAIIDLMMPSIDGLDILKYLKTEKRLMRIPVMVITAQQGIKTLAESLSAGAVVLLPKPFKAEELRRSLHILLNNKPTLQGDKNGRRHAKS